MIFFMREEKYKTILSNSQILHGESYVVNPLFLYHYFFNEVSLFGLVT
jgi:hypothetical protein